MFCSPSPSSFKWVGLHVGEVVVGNIGSEARAKYGIVGSAVNLTHRIQGQAKGGEVVISEPTYQKAGPGLAVQKTFETRLKGIQEPVALYVVEDIAEIPTTRLMAAAQAVA